MDNVLCQESSNQEDVFLRSVHFVKTLFKSPSYEVATVARILIKDQRSVMGGNMAIIEQTTGFDPLRLSRMQLKNALKFRAVIPDDLGWVPETLNDLLED